jgi:hypothetical protein
MYFLFEIITKKMYDIKWLISAGAKWAIKMKVPWLSVATMGFQSLVL